MNEEEELDRREEWAAWLAWRDWRRARRRRRFWAGLAIALVWAGLGAAGFVLWCLRDLPRPEAALDRVRKPSLIVQDAGGADIASYGDVVGEPLRLADLPPFLPQAAVAVEDRRYYEHGGLDWAGIARAAWVDLRDRRVAQGGSTIAQQVAKTLFLSNARTVRRKAQELVLTHWLETTFTKREILEIWLNRVYLGQGAWGVDAAAHVYFGISARRLNLWQAAMIAGLPRAPSRFNPRTDPRAAAARTREVLEAMVQARAITRAQADAAAEAIDVSRLAVRQGGWFADFVAGEAQALVPADTDAVVGSSLRRGSQDVVERALGAVLDGPGVAAAVHQGAVVVLDAGSGAVEAMAGGRDYAASPYNRAVAARRQPGSAFKPFVWLNAVEHGATPDDAVLDAPIRIGGYAPQDFSRQYLGRITLEEALALSVNTVSVRLLLAYGGARAVAAVAHRLGVTGRLPDDASLALGTGEVSLLELAGAYAGFCNGGMQVRPHGVVSLSLGGRAATVPDAKAMPVMAPDEAATMARMLQAVVARGTGRAASVAGHAVLGKTGTTQDFRDAWFVGCLDRRRVIGVWLGNDDDAPMRHVEGGGLPAKLFSTIAAGLAG